MYTSLLTVLLLSSTGNAAAVATSDSQHDTKLKKGLVEALIAAAATEKVSGAREVIGAKGGGCTGCPFTPTKSTFYNMPAFIRISHKVDWSADDAPDAIALTVANPGDDGGKGLCKVAIGIGAAMAGVVNGAAGGAFKLGRLACSLI
ncbi:hypothetical protein BU25DRAFT_455472 [Macroventuria anomochaeta]|uniref:Uncharacterized protein n=1 Tax=Macroventuria anomochaeta TaxID=301207 RepID=A0ACB6SDG7_9PLEO|nr:uncharacterized protein BU25DRAFT_455472 [Macroventuria anomochaeta]KAF2631147.1 hypothetical protein BU25DRAFT_455472 [Macroventuria anomochaeta]